MKRRAGLYSLLLRIIVILFLGFMASATVCADGGKLLFRSEFPPAEYDSQELSYNSFAVTGTQADVQLDSGKTEIFHVFEIGNTNGIRIMISAHRPYRIFSDLNQDKIYQPGELFTSSASSSYGDSFQNIPIICRIEGATLTVNLDLECNHMAGDTYLSIQSVKSDYAGDIQVGGVSYPARLVLNLDRMDSNEASLTILLDNDHDGRFNKQEGTLFNSGGYAFIDGQVYESQLIFSATQADLNLKPYEGSMGLLKLEGSGIRNVHLGYRPENADPGQIPRDMIFSLPAGVAKDFRLPDGHYRVVDAWIGSASESGNLYRLDKQKVSGVSRIVITADVTDTLRLGGPLTDSVRVSPNWLMGRVQLDYDGCRNAAGVYYSLVREPTSETSDAPDYEIRDASGVRVASGQFEYG